jgi:hypothetical protein
MTKKSKRGRTQLIIGDVMYRITEVSELGQHVAPRKFKDKFVSQCEAIVRDNVPIKYREWKGKPSNPYVVPDSVKDQLWNDVLKHFSLPEGVDAYLVKGWILVKMATQFQNFKKKLTRDFYQEQPNSKLG